MKVRKTSLWVLGFFLALTIFASVFAFSDHSNAVSTITFGSDSPQLIITTCNAPNNGLTACETTNGQCRHRTCICTPAGGCTFTAWISQPSSQGYTCQGNTNHQRCTKSNNHCAAHDCLPLSELE